MMCERIRIAKDNDNRSRDEQLREPYLCVLHIDAIMKAQML